MVVLRKRPVWDGAGFICFSACRAILNRSCGDPNLARDAMGAVRPDSMLSAAAAASRVDCRQGNCIHLPPGMAEFPVRQQTLTDDAAAGIRSADSPLQNLSDGAQCACRMVAWAGHRENAGFLAPM